MLLSLSLVNVGPAPTLKADFKPRLNLITGDNGLGKSFLLDIAWWALTRKWPRELNRMLTSGDMARPTGKRTAKIAFQVKGVVRAVAYSSSYSPLDQAWTGQPGRPLNPGLVLYAMADGSFASWDPARNYWLRKGNLDVQERVPAYVFGPRDIWDGLRKEPGGDWLCSGLIADWASWQKENGEEFRQLKAVLTAISPPGETSMTPGGFVRLSLDDPRDIPTLTMPYGMDVPIMFASAGVRRILALAYLLVWNWQEHQKASVLLGKATTRSVTFLIDEVEAHLHPRWQRVVVLALLDIMSSLAPQAEVQIILATHSPLVMASVEPVFDPKKDAWFDIDLVAGRDSTLPQVKLKERPFVRLGEVSNWLTSDAFDLSSSRSLQAEDVLEHASRALANQNLTRAEARKLQAMLSSVLGDTDPFWVRWRYVGEKQGWLPKPQPTKNVSGPAAQRRNPRQ